MQNTASTTMMRCITVPLPSGDNEEPLENERLGGDDAGAPIPGRKEGIGEPQGARCFDVADISSVPDPASDDEIIRDGSGLTAAAHRSQNASLDPSLAKCRQPWKRKNREKRNPQRAPKARAGVRPRLSHGAAAQVVTTPLKTLLQPVRQSLHVPS